MVITKFRYLTPVAHLTPLAVCLKRLAVCCVRVVFSGSVRRFLEDFAAAISYLCHVSQAALLRLSHCYAERTWLLTARYECPLEFLLRARRSIIMPRLQQQNPTFIHAHSALTVEMHGTENVPSTLHLYRFVSARCNIYISRLCYDVSVRLSVTVVHWRINAL